MNRAESELVQQVANLYRKYGQRKTMGGSAPDTKHPHFFLLRPFLSQTDLLIILNTKRCRYQCHFCQLPAKSSIKWIESEEVLAQFGYVMEELKHSLSIVERVTLSNEGSVLDKSTFPREALYTIVSCVNEMRRVRTLVLETRLEFVTAHVLNQIHLKAPRVEVDVLTGFETQSSEIRDRILGKREPIESFLRGLDTVAEAGSRLTSYVLYKSSPIMNDEEAYEEASKTIDFLQRECMNRGIPLCIRINPMYLARGSRWAQMAAHEGNYSPPRLTDLMRLAEQKSREGLKIYIGLSTEGLGDVTGTYLSREDYSPRMIKAVLQFNAGKIAEFDWSSLSNQDI